MAVQHHFVVVPSESGSLDEWPLKPWLRMHPEILPGADPDTVTTHQLRDALLRSGWRKEETPTKVLLYMPTANEHLLEQHEDEMRGPPGRGSESQVANQLAALLAERLPSDYEVHTGKNILYKIEVNALGQITPESLDSPVRGQFAFQTDISIERRSPAIPLVVIELKVGSFTTHDVITYSAKAARHKLVYPYLRYGFIVVGINALTRRFLTHNEGFDFAMALPDLLSRAGALHDLVTRQIDCAERLTRHMESNRTSFTQYEELVELN